MTQIEAMVSDNGEGGKVTLVVPPELRRWQHFAISSGEARILAAKLIRAADLVDAVGLRSAAERALVEMCNTVAPRDSFTDAVDALDAALHPRN